MTPLVGLSPAEHVAAQLQSRTDPSDDSPDIRTHVRIAVSSMAIVVAMAERADRSRNYIINQLLVVGAQAVLDAMPEAERDAVILSSLAKQSDLVEGAE